MLIYVITFFGCDCESCVEGSWSFDGIKNVCTRHSIQASILFKKYWRRLRLDAMVAHQLNNDIEVAVERGVQLSTWITPCLAIVCFKCKHTEIAWLSHLALWDLAIVNSFYSMRMEPTKIAWFPHLASWDLVIEPTKIVWFPHLASWDLVIVNSFRVMRMEPTDN